MNDHRVANSQAPTTFHAQLRSGTHAGHGDTTLREPPIWRRSAARPTSTPPLRRLFCNLTERAPGSFGVRAQSNEAPTFGVGVHSAMHRSTGARVLACLRC